MVASGQRLGLYTALSPLDADPERPLRELRLFAERRGFRVAAEYIDRGFFPDPHRPQRAHLLEAVLNGKLTAVAIWRLDRGGRSLHDVVAWIDQIVRAGAGFFSVEENLDFAGPVARQFMMAFVQAQHHFLAERVHAGFEAAKARGQKLGRPPKPIDAASIQTDYERGFSLREVAPLHRISHSTVLKVIHGSHPQREK